jgi:hypothetical protein
MADDIDPNRDYVSEYVDALREWDACKTGYGVCARRVAAQRRASQLWHLAYRAGRGDEANAAAAALAQADSPQP